jgi:hypothetical protein
MRLETEINDLLFGYAAKMRQGFRVEQLHQGAAKITTPFKDRHSKNIAIYVHTKEDGFRLSEESAITDLLDSGATISIDLLNEALPAGVTLLLDNTLETHADHADFHLRLGVMIRAALYIDTLADHRWHNAVGIIAPSVKDEHVAEKDEKVLKCEALLSECADVIGEGFRVDRVNDRELRVTTPHRDRYGDYIQIYVREEGDGFRLIEGGVVQNIGGLAWATDEQRKSIRSALPSFMKLDDENKTLEVWCGPHEDFGVYLRDLIRAVEFVEGRADDHACGISPDCPMPVPAPAEKAEYVAYCERETNEFGWFDGTANVARDSGAAQRFSSVDAAISAIRGRANVNAFMHVHVFAVSGTFSRRVDFVREKV